jgi:hypothetical protein
VLSRPRRSYASTDRLLFVMLRPPQTEVQQVRFDDIRSVLEETIQPLVSLVVFSFSMAIVLLTWEDYTCSYTLPSRQRTSLNQMRDRPQSWGESTIRGMGFGHDERTLLLQDGASSIPSYNEVMLEHRVDRVPRWKRQMDDSAPISQLSIARAIHTLCECLKILKHLEELASDYHWNEVRAVMLSEPLTSLEEAASLLRTLENPESAVIGFDWGSCAWRHCGALADAQEALDELDHLLGVLEPPEVIFCLDVVERSLRDMLTSVPWESASADDVQFWKHLPAYRALVSQSEIQGDGENSLDADYLKALQELRID